MNNNPAYAFAGEVSLRKSAETLSSHWISAFSIRRKGNALSKTPIKNTPIKNPSPMYR